MKALKLIAGLALSALAGVAGADLVWDGFAEVPAVDKMHNGTYLTCPPGTHFVFDKGSSVQVDTEWCYTGSVLYERAGRPIEATPQGLLDLHMKPPAGFKLVAQGPLPVYGRNGRVPMYLLIAYKVTKTP